MARPRKDAFTSEGRSGREEVLKEERPNPPEKKKKRLFVSPHQKQGFKVPVKDEKGNIMTLTKPGTNMPVLINGRLVPVLRDASFSTQSNNVKRGCLSYFETDDPDEIAVLEALAADPSTEIMTEEEYLRKKDPVNFELRGELNETKQKVDTLSADIVAKNDIIAELNSQIEQLTSGK